MVDISNNRVQVFTANGGFLFKFGALGTGNGEFNHPSGVATDCTGNVYVTDYGNNRVEKFGNPAAQPPCVVPRPSNALSFGKLKLNRKKGTATLPVTVAEPAP